ncbi:MAG TPA: BTAD domain-containing putative transcriptional regulator [Natronosporangium sp.]
MSRSRLSLLGPVQLWAADQLIDLGSPKQRTVVAALAVDLGRVVSVDTLIDRVWGPQPPADPRTALYSYLARTRRALRAAAGDDLPRLSRRPAGYLLEFDPDRVDLHRFTRLTKQAHDPQCTDGERCRLLREALALWHGEPLAGLTGDWVERVRRGWYRRRLDAVVDWARAEVAAGDPAAVIGPVTELLDQDPLVEPLVAVLMRALAATGRAAEAMQAYDRLRTRLAEQLGTDPGGEVASAHLAILRGTPQPAHQWVTGPPRPTPVPAQLPAAVPGFVGRQRQLAELDGMLAEAEAAGSMPICVLSGTAGVGKTSLAVQWAHRVRDRFPDGQLYVNLRGFDPTGTVTSPTEAIRGFLNAFGVPADEIPAELAEQSARFRSLLAGRRVLVVLDNARDAEQVRPLLPGSPGCLALVTSRDRLTSLVATDGARPVILELLAPAEARELLARRLGADRLAAEPAAVATAINRCARLPLALAILAARAATNPNLPLGRLAGELDTALDALAAGDPTADVRAVFSWSYRALDPPAARLFRLLGLHTGPEVSVPAAASLAGLPVPETRRLLAGLTRAHLLTEEPVDRYGRHDLLRAYAVELTDQEDPAAERRAAIGRLLDHYLHTAYRASTLLNPHGDLAAPPAHQPGAVVVPHASEDEAKEWFAAEQPALIAATALAGQAGFDDHAWRLARCLTTFLDRRGGWDDLAATHQVGLAAAERLGNRAAQAVLHRGLARADAQRGRYGDGLARLAQAERLYRELGDHLGLAHTQLSMAVIHDRQRRFGEALAELEAALAGYQRVGDQPGQARALNNLGWLHVRLGAYQRALDYCRQALAIHEQTGDRHGAAVAHDSAGYAHYHLGDHRAAVACYRRALALFRLAGNRVEAAVTLVNLGDALLACDDQPAAVAVWRQALAIFDELGHPSADAVEAKLRALGQPV